MFFLRGADAEKVGVRMDGIGRRSCPWKDRVPGACAGKQKRHALGGSQNPASKGGLASFERTIAHHPRLSLLLLSGGGLERLLFWPALLEHVAVVIQAASHQHRARSQMSTTHGRRGAGGGAGKGGRTS